jgi:hypothetical protein
VHAPRHEDGENDRSAGPGEKPRDERRPKKHGKPHGDSEPKFGKAPGFEKKKRSWDKAAHAGPSRPTGAPAAKGPFGKKGKKNRRP